MKEKCGDVKSLLQQILNCAFILTMPAAISPPSAVQFTSVKDPEKDLIVIRWKAHNMSDYYSLKLSAR